MLTNNYYCCHDEYVYVSEKSFSVTKQYPHINYFDQNKNPSYRYVHHIRGKKYEKFQRIMVVSP